MKAITLWRPWARYVATGEKRIENRPWAPPAKMLGETIAIHAGRAWQQEMVAYIERVLGRSIGLDVQHEGIIGTARLAGWFHLTAGAEWKVVNGVPQPFATRISGEVGEVAITDVDQQWCFGPVCWVLRDFKPFVTPIACRGFQKFWEIDRGLKGARLEDFQRAIAA